MNENDLPDMRQFEHSRSAAFLITLNKVVRHLLEGDREGMRSLVRKGLKKLNEIRAGYGALMPAESVVVSDVDVIRLGRTVSTETGPEWVSAGGVMLFPPEQQFSIVFDPSAIPEYGIDHLQQQPEDVIAYLDGPTFIKAFINPVAEAHRNYLGHIWPREYNPPVNDPTFYYEMPADGLVIDSEVFVQLKGGKAEYSRAAVISEPGQNMRIVDWQEALELQENFVINRKPGTIWGTPFYFDSRITKEEVKAGMRALGDDDQFSAVLELWDSSDKKKLNGRAYVNIQGVSFHSFIAFCLAVSQRLGENKGLKGNYCVGAMLEKTGSDAVVSEPDTGDLIQVPDYRNRSIHARNGFIMVSKPAQKS